MEHKMDVVAAWEQTANYESKENRKSTFNETSVKSPMESTPSNAYYKQMVAHEEHPWRGKTAFGFATILNRNGDHELGASPVGMSLPPLQAYPMTAMDKKAPHGRPTPIAPLGESVDLSSLPGRSLKLKIKKKHIDITPSFQTPIAPSSSGARKLPLAPAPPLDEDDDDSGDDVEEGAVSSNGTAIRGGRWTSEEHERFLSGFRLHGHKWKRVQMVVRSRTVTQVRTHAQKYLLKLQKISGEPRTSSSGEANYMTSFGSGATSPTQSMQSANDDLDSATMDDTQPVSPDVAGPGQDMHVSPSKLKRSSTPPSKKNKPPLKKVRRAPKPESAFIEEAAYALCSLMTHQIIEDLEMTDQEEAEEDVSPAAPSSPQQQPHQHKKRYLCRKCRVPKKGHVCDVGNDDEVLDDVDEKAGKDLQPLAAYWNNVNDFVGQNILRCLGPNSWARGTIDRVVAADGESGREDQIHIVYSEDTEGRNEWLSKADAIECVAIESAGRFQTFPTAIATSSAGENDRELSP
ncbi:hypothetical protein AeMF1_009804 [Aphanomyces euteiches]|nr:hypothetical protein AeMF1_009804 [Aphanomyces euteiches]KAH9194113.1 hypothetical protein AeNC1_003920 [Aphanomyces euteiches]